MNPLQSYEMQSILQPGDTVIDVGANLGCYTLPFAERVGAAGKVIAVEPFRWLRQIVASNVAINGLSNVWLPPVGLGAARASFEARPPQFKFFSSPGGVKLHQQQDMKPEEVMQMYDWDVAPERITVLTMDELLGVVPAAGVELLGLPPVDGVRLIKIDVEGMEKEVIAGARAVVQMFKPIIWSENVAYFSSKGLPEASQDTCILMFPRRLLALINRNHASSDHSPGCQGQDVSFLQLPVLQYGKRCTFFCTVHSVFSPSRCFSDQLRLMDELEYNCAGAQNAPNDIICTDRHGRGHQIS